jgi:hypothetical protein
LSQALEEISTALLQKMADSIGVSSKGKEEKLRMEVIMWAAEREKTSMAQTDEFSVPRHTRKSPVPTALSGAGRRSLAGEDDTDTDSISQEESFDTCSDDDSDSASSLDDRRRRERKVQSFAQPLPSSPRPRASRDARDGFQFVKGAVVSVVGKDAKSRDVRRVMDTLREAAQSRDSRIGVERFIATLSRHRSADQPKGLNVKTGKFFGPHKPVAVRDSLSPWAFIDVSYNFAEEDAILADELVDECLTEISGHQAGLTITMDASYLTGLYSAPTIYGWAELASGAGAAAMEILWHPLLHWQWTACSADEIEASLRRKLAKVISNLAAEIAICDEFGSKRLTGLLCTTLIAVQSLIHVRQSNEATWPLKVQRWLENV